MQPPPFVFYFHFLGIVGLDWYIDTAYFTSENGDILLPISDSFLFPETEPWVFNSV